MKQKNIIRPTEAYLKILQILWISGPSTVRYVNDILNENKKAIEKEFNCEVEIIKAEKSQEGKAKQAIPGKVAILVE